MTETDDPPYQDVDRMVDLYWNKRMSCGDIADHFDISHSTASNWITRLHIQQKNPEA